MGCPREGHRRNHLFVPENADRSIRALLRHLAMDLSPLRDSFDFRLLSGSDVVTMFGTFLTLKAAPVQG